MDTANQKRMAAEILSCGQGRVWMDPNRLEDISEAVTRLDVRKLISSGAIRAKQKRGISRVRALYRAAQKKKGRRRGSAHRKGGSNARFSFKRRWMARIRPIRKRLRELRDSGTLDRAVYRKLYRQAKGGMFHNRSHLETQLRLRGILKTEQKPPRRDEQRRRLRRERARSVIQPSRLQKGEKKLRRKDRKKKVKPAPAGKEEPAKEELPEKREKPVPEGNSGREA